MMTYRPLIRAFKALYDEARADLRALNFRHQCAIADLHRELDACRAELDELKAAVLARQKAQDELASSTGNGRSRVLVQLSETAPYRSTNGSLCDGPECP